jgi:hypothetical protein
MNLSYKDLLPAGFSGQSRVWVYQSSRLFTLTEALAIEEILEDFAKNWKSHSTPVKGFGTLFFGQFIVLIADETSTGVSGCSTDSSVRVVKEIETAFKVNMFDRTNLAFVVKDKVQLIPMAQLNYAIDNGFIGPETLFFDNNITNLDLLESKWILPIKDSWLAKRILKTV